LQQGCRLLFPGAELRCRLVDNKSRGLVHPKCHYIYRASPAYKSAAFFPIKVWSLTRFWSRWN